MIVLYIQDKNLYIQNKNQNMDYNKKNHHKNVNVVRKNMTLHYYMLSESALLQIVCKTS